MTSESPVPQPVDPLTLATLYLCNIAYNADITTIPAAIGGAPLLDPGPYWKCLWGPAQDSDESNLAFVAGYFPSAGAKTPQYICVTIRGTDVDIDDIWGILYQVWEDLDATTQLPLPWEQSDPARVAKGTLDGLAVIEALTAPDGQGNEQSLSDYLTAFLSDPANANVTSLVTGHSLGACLATVVAPWMRSLVPGYKGTIQPITFAGPTAGDVNFANYYDKHFPTARRYQNSLDVVPRAYYDLDIIHSIYANLIDGIETPEFVNLGIDVMTDELDYYELSYVQPSRGAQILDGIFLLSDTDWYAQALHQHHLATYLALLTNTPVNEAALPRPGVLHSIERRLIRRIGSMVRR